jgi:LysR family hydrogen peroxide-inducible transcriptional activator
VTSEGENIVRRARLILRNHEDLQASAKGGGLFHGRLRLGSLTSIGPYLLPEVVRRLHKDYPNFWLVVREENTCDLDQGLRNGRLDMIISTPEDHSSMHHKPLFEEEFWVASALDYLQDSHTESSELSDLHGQTFLTLGPKHRLSQMVAMLASRVGGRVSDEYEGTSLDAIWLMAATGAGIAILPQIYAMKGLAGRRMC